MSDLVNTLVWHELF